MLAQNKIGRKLRKYLNINESNIKNYNAVLNISDKFLIGYNK